MSHSRHRLEISVDTDDLGRRILTLAGDVDLRTAGRFRDQIVDAPTGATTVVIDMGDVVFMDSPGLGALVHCQRVLAARGGAPRRPITSGRCLRPARDDRRR